MGLRKQSSTVAHSESEPMIRKTVLGLALALILALPSAGQAQNDAGGRGSGRQGVATAEAQEFLAAFRIIHDYGLEVHSDSTPWFRAVDGLTRNITHP